MTYFKISISNLKKIAYGILFLWILINNILSTCISFFNYFDETIEIICIAYIILNITKVFNRSDCSKIILILFIIIILGLLGNIIFKYQSSITGITKDIFAFIKFPIISCALLYRKNQTRFNDELALNIAYVISKVFVFFVGLLGIVSLFKDIGLSSDLRNGIYSYKFLFSHPTFLVASLVITSTVLVAKNNSKDLPLVVLNLFTLILTMRDKAIGYVILFVIVIWIFPIFKIKKVKIRSFVLPTLLIFYEMKDKIVEYNNFSWSPRTALYFDGIDLMKKCFPFGSGFCTWGGSLTGEYYSSAYYLYDMENRPGTSLHAFYDLGDAGIPYYYSNFGIIGFALFIYLLIIIFKSAISLYNKVNYKTKAVILLIGYIIIALPFENVLTNESGATIALIMFIYLGKTYSTK